jgi:hypothetical protein
VLRSSTDGLFTFAQKVFLDLICGHLAARIFDTDLFLHDRRGVFYDA